MSSFHEGSFLGLHFSPILVIPAVIERLVGPDVRILNLLHALAVAALVPASFLFLRALLRPSRLGPPLAAVLAIGVPVWGTMQDVIRSDFHPETAGIGLALLAGWAGLTKRHRTMWALALVALATREDVSYAVAVVGLAVAVRGRGSTRDQGRFLVLAATAWAIAVFGLAMPAIRAGARTDTDRYYALARRRARRPGRAVRPDRRRSSSTSRGPTPWLAAAGMIVALLGLPLARPRWLPPRAAADGRRAAVRQRVPGGPPAPVRAGARRAADRGRRVRRTTGAGGHRATVRRRRAGGHPALDTGRVPGPAARPRARGCCCSCRRPWERGCRVPFPRSARAIRRSSPGRRPGPAAGDGRPSSPATRCSLPTRDWSPRSPGEPTSGVSRPGRSRGGLVRGHGPRRLVADSRARRRHDELLASLLAGDRPVLVDDGQFIVWGPEQGGVAP